MTHNAMQHIALQHFTDAIPAQQWTFAASMPTMPHEYTLRKRWVQANVLTFADAVAIVRTYGTPQRFGSRTFIYLHIGEWKYWTMGNPIEQTTVLNRARV